MTNYECGRALVYIAEQIIKTFGKDFGLEVQELKQESAEPLIKDEKIRKAVRAWAEVNELEPDYEVKYDADTYGLNSWQADINFNYRIEGLEHNKKYIIAELCGEEEE